MEAARATSTGERHVAVRTGLCGTIIAFADRPKTP